MISALIIGLSLQHSHLVSAYLLQLGMGGLGLLLTGVHRVG